MRDFIKFAAELPDICREDLLKAAYYTLSFLSNMGIEERNKMAENKKLLPEQEEEFKAYVERLSKE